MSENGTNIPPDGTENGNHGPELPRDTDIPVVSMDEIGLRDFLAKLRSGEKFIADLAAKLGVSAQTLGEVLAGKAGFGPKLLEGLGVVRVRQIYDVGPKWIEFDE